MLERSAKNKRRLGVPKTHNDTGAPLGAWCEIERSRSEDDVDDVDAHHEALVTPGRRPCRAMLRKLIRLSWNFR
jgi:hypothetical protein